MDQQLRLRRVIAGWLVLAVASVGLVVAVGSTDQAPNPWLTVGLAMAVFVAGIRPIEIRHRGVSHGVTLSELAVLPMALLLPAVWAIGTFVLATLLTEITLHRRDALKFGFNLGWAITAFAATVLVFDALGTTPIDPAPATITAAVLAAITYVVVNLFAISGLRMILERQRWRAVVRQQAPASATISLGASLTGIVAAVLWQVAPLALPLLIAPAALSLSGGRTHARQHRRLASERDRLERTVAGSSDGIVLLDADGCVEVWNPVMVELTGTDRETALGTDLDQLGWARLLPDHQDLGPEHHLHHGGRTLGIRRSHLADGAGTVLAVRDISREAELARIRDELVSNISHELRTPLTTTQGFLETLEQRWDGLDDPARRRFVISASHSAQRLARLLESLMVWSRIEDRHGDPADDAADLAEVAAAARSQASLLDPPATLHLDVHASGRVSLLGSDVAMVIDHLLDNAVLYGRPPVNIEVVAQDGHLHLAVTDHGAGIDPRFDGELFEPFAQASEGLRRTARGLGIGLAVCRSLVEGAGGTIRHEAPTVGGARFVVTLPIRDGLPSR